MKFLSPVRLPNGKTIMCTLVVGGSVAPTLPTLQALTGSLSVPENSANGTVVGTPTGYTAGSTKSFSDNAGGRFAIDSSSGQITVANGLLLDYETNTSHSVTIVETLTGATGSPKSTTLSIAVTDVSDTASPAAVFTMTQLPDADRIYQRTTTSGGGQGKGQGTIPVTINCTVAGNLYARIRSSSGTILQASYLIGTVTPGTYAVNVTGVDARLGWFYVDLSGNGASWSNGTTLVGMGALFAWAGQSLMSRMIGRADTSGSHASSGITPPANGRVLASYADTNFYEPTIATMPWQQPGDMTDGTGPTSVGVSGFLNDAISQIGINCGVIGHARGGIYLAAYISGQPDWTRFSDTIARAGGAFEGFYWGQGHSDSSVCCSAAAYEDMLELIYAQVDAINSFPGFNTYIWTIPAIRSNTLGTDWQYNNVRKGAKNWCDANGGTYVHIYDIPLGDFVHQTNTAAGAGWMGRAMWRAARSNYGLSSGIGPALVSATRSGTTITLTVSDVGQTGFTLAGSPQDLFKVFRTGETNNKDSGVNDNRYPVSVISVVNKTTISLTLANNPGVGQALDLWLNYGILPTDTSANYIVDNRTDDGLSRGRNLQANFSPIVVAAPTPGGATNPPPVVAANVSTLTFSPTSAAYGSGASGFGQRLTGGRGTSSVSASFIPAYTLEGFFVAPTIGSTLVLFNNLPGGEWLGILGSGQISLTAGLTGATTLVAGKLYYYALVAGPTGKRIYLQNITDGTAGVRDANTSSALSNWPNGTANFQIGHLGGSFVFTGAGGQIDEHLYSYGEKFSGTAITAPTSPFTGTETNAVGLWHFDGNMTEVIQR